MRTDELIVQLAEQPPRRAAGVPARLLATAALGAAAGVVVLLLRLGVRPDLALAVTTWPFWMKLAYGTALALAGFLAIERLARPGGSGRRGLMVAALVFCVLAGLGIAQILAAGPDDRLGLWLGRSWRRCPTNVLTLAAPMLAIGLVVVRRLAPTRLALAGGAIGLFAGGVGMIVYCLHCPETEPAFVATWYSLGALLTAAVGATLGLATLRWR